MFSENLNRKIVQITIPILNYYGDGVFYQEIYFDCEASPTKEEVLEYLKDLHNRDSKYPEYLGCWEDCIKSVNAVQEWPWLGNNTLQTNGFVDREDLRVFEHHLPITFKVLIIKKL